MKRYAILGLVVIVTLACFATTADACFGRRGCAVTTCCAPACDPCCTPAVTTCCDPCGGTAFTTGFRSRSSFSNYGAYPPYQRAGFTRVRGGGCCGGW